MFVILSTDEECLLVAVPPRSVVQLGLKLGSAAGPCVHRMPASLTRELRVLCLNYNLFKSCYPYTFVFILCRLVAQNKKAQ